MSNNEFGFPVGTTGGPQFSRVSSLNLAASFALPDPVENKLSLLSAYRLLAIGQQRQAHANARTGVEGFHARILEAYGTTWDKQKEREGFKGSHGCNAMTAELASLERDLKAAQRAEAIYASDVPISRGSLQLLEGLATECVRFVNRSRGNVKQAEPVTLSKGDEPKALQAALEAADERIETVERAWPTFESAWSDIARKLDSVAKLPRVVVHERTTPDNAPRALPVHMVPSFELPERESLHAVAPGQQLLLVQNDTVGLIFGLLRPQIEELLKGKLEALYKDAPLIIAARERKTKLEEAKAAKLSIERKLSELFWLNRAPATVLSFDTDPRAVLGIE